jgi:hypothetical protein
MLTIAILAPDCGLQIEKILTSLLKQNHKKYAVIKKPALFDSECEGLSQIGTEYCIINFDRGFPPSCFVDILILDTAGKKDLLSPSLLRCLAPDAILIYNADTPDEFQVRHPSAISYGLSSAALATVSSIDTVAQDTCFTYCLQTALKSIHGNLLLQQEFSVHYPRPNTNLYHLLPAVTCSIVCDLMV